MDIPALIGHVFSLQSVLMASGGTILGILIGAVPGLNGPIGVAVLLPITFNMAPSEGLILLGGLYMGSTYGGSISAILLNCPGTSEAACTALDGYAMARQGNAGKALRYSILASTFGGIAGCLVLLFLTPVLADAALAFGPPEMFMVALAGLAFVGSMSGDKLRYGFLAVALGVFCSTIGPDFNTGDYRFTMGIRELRAGIPLVPMIVGLFAVTEMLLLAGSSHDRIVDVRLRPSSVRHCLTDIVRHYKAILMKSTLIGIWVGLLPGTGSSVAAFVSYGEARRTSEHPETFGSGNPEGVIAPEAANNAAVGSALVPLLALGVPGSATAAIMYGALTMHNIIPGPSLLGKSPDTAYTFMGGMLVATLVMAFCGIACIRLFVKAPSARVSLVIPCVLVASLVGTYTLNNSLFDVYLALLFGITGILFRKIGIPPAPLLLGLILGPTVEQNLLRSMTLAEAGGRELAFYMLGRPVCAGCFFLVLFLVYKMFRPHLARVVRHRRKA